MHSSCSKTTVPGKALAATAEVYVGTVGTVGMVGTMGTAGTTGLAEVAAQATAMKGSVATEVEMVGPREAELEVQSEGAKTEAGAEAREAREARVAAAVMAVGVPACRWQVQTLLCCTRPSRLASRDTVRS